MKKLIIIYLGNINSVPPVRSLLSSLSLIKDIETHLVVTSEGLDKDDSMKGLIDIHYIDETYKKTVSLIEKIARTKRIRRKIWQTIDCIYDSNSLLWVISDVCVKNLGKRLKQYNYVLHLFELIETAYLIPKYKLGKFDIEDYAKMAKQVVVPEYNRAHITKAWWGLNKLPFVLPNKPFYNEIPSEKDLEITHSDIARRIVAELSDKKIILYQGIIHKERPLENFVKAVDRLGSGYAFVVMSAGDDPYKTIGTSNYYFIPFVPAPFHLEITSHAFIGVLSYVPVKTTYSILNAVYCAPNKTFEYSRFGIPMISNDVPGLDYLFNKEKCGRIADIDSVESICDTIEFISENYELLSDNARNYYNSVNYQEAVNTFLMRCFDD